MHLMVFLGRLSKVPGFNCLCPIMTDCTSAHIFYWATTFADAHVIDIYTHIIATWPLHSRKDVKKKEQTKIAAATADPSGCSMHKAVNCDTRCGMGVQDVSQECKVWRRGLRETGHGKGK